MSTILETQHHIIEFEDADTCRVFKRFCKDLKVSYDYYMFEFDVDVDEDS